MSAAIALGVPSNRAQPSRALVIKIDITAPQGKRTLTALVDSGAQENFIDQRVVKELDLASKPAPIRATSIDGHTLKTYGLVDCETHATDGRGTTRSLPQSFISTDIRKFDMILGWPWLVSTDCDCHWR